MLVTPKTPPISTLEGRHFALILSLLIGTGMTQKRHRHWLHYFAASIYWSHRNSPHCAGVGWHRRHLAMIENSHRVHSDHGVDAFVPTTYDVSVRVNTAVDPCRPQQLLYR